MERVERLRRLHSEYTGCLSDLERTADAIAGLERRVFAELGDTLALT
jgi:hypothetical protein